MKDPFLAAKQLLIEIEASGFEAYFVGGSVRDLLLEREISDVDIATSATPQEIKAIFPKTIDVGVEHGTIIVLFHGIPYEVTTFRSEAEYEAFRRPKEVKFIRSLEEDLQRRDFTMNAIAMDKEGQLIDPFQGKVAIENQTIQTVGKAKERFQEDALRMMRAVRFYSQLGFEIEASTREALITYAPLLEHISTERKLVEFEKLLAGENRIEALKMICITGLYQYLPNLTSRKDELAHVLTYDCSRLTIEEMWGLIIYQFSLDEKGRINFLKSWKLPMKRIKYIQHIVRWLYFRVDKKWTDETIYHAGKEAVLAVEKLFNTIHKITEGTKHVERLIDQYESLAIKNRSELQVTGTDLQTWFQRTPGPWIKETINQVEEAVINQKISNHKESIKEWLDKCKQS
ncbi:tRNA nucleotidyltransferase (CCA-adding enzyme) [Cytobacillus eiseniae]|uniref:CCA-adding enzyme n=1 Tax=Cytobacillus eiseniae TaxID=762947 RepID=A0ABS4RHN8_9BACI|nr:CCA tRNA nucleotidyltransferase [Cytobacillus eiseniae]MBP2241352.1 tRNA nucleotidyltransferase (CCA-adding enzyme) [Cytobacillus eiseniae]